MAKQDEISSNDPEYVNGSTPLQEAPSASARRYLISKKVTDHLANERTFLAWVRTGLAIMGFGFIVERFGLLVREIGTKITNTPIPSQYSSIVGITLTLLGVLVMIVALLNFLQARRAIDKEHFHPHRGFAIFLTIITCLIGAILAIYLFLAA
jgi:putative membrane protein